MEDALGSKYFGTSLDGYDCLINYDEEDIAKCDPMRRDINYLQIPLR